MEKVDPIKHSMEIKPQRIFKTTEENGTVKKIYFEYSYESYIEEVFYFPAGKLIKQTLFLEDYLKETRYKFVTHDNKDFLALSHFHTLVKYNNKEEFAMALDDILLVEKSKDIYRNFEETVGHDCFVNQKWKEYVDLSSEHNRNFEIYDKGILKEGKDGSFIFHTFEGRIFRGKEEKEPLIHTVERYYEQFDEPLKDEVQK
ncbi:MAG: hypothetical protein AB7S44_03300 [Spirochaetales bacterium]